jgi:2-phospho-L-lactate guanylyltransferase
MPVKRLGLAKTRLRHDRRTALALAMAVDTAAAVLDCPLVVRLVVVTDDADAARELARCGATVVGDEPDAGLNAALCHGARVAVAGGWVSKGGMSPGGIAALSADLPALRPSELEEVLRLAAAQPSTVVADAARAGTTFYAVTGGHPFRPAFGPGSLERHRAAGASVVELPSIPGLRRDVDTAEDLKAAAALGVGRATRRVLNAGGTGGTTEARARAGRPLAR